MGCGYDINLGLENNHEKEFQNMSQWKDYSVTMLRNHVNEAFRSDEVRVYTVASTRLCNNKIKHFGSGPNLEGNLATLCTCKRKMRAFGSVNYWEDDKWILGVTSRAKANGFGGVHYLLYLMKIEHAFESHHQLYKYLQNNSKNNLKIKNASTNPLGDIYEPIEECENDPNNPKRYRAPHKSHSHGYKDGEEWEEDIINTPLLLGSKEHTFVWQTPAIVYKENRGVGNKKIIMGKLLDELIEAS